MKTCPKCKHQDNSPEPVSCPKCGVIYAKIEEAQRTKSVQERLSQQLENTLRAEEEISSQHTFSDKEWELDQESYPTVQSLSSFFNIFAILTAIAWALGTVQLWSVLGEIPYFTTSGRYTLTIVYLFSAAMPIALCLALSWALKLGKDIADNTRATRHYMSQLSQKKKGRT